MKKIINYLFEKKTEKIVDKGSIDCINIQVKDKITLDLCLKIFNIMNIQDTYTMEDAIQDVMLGICKHSPEFFEKESVDTTVIVTEFNKGQERKLIKTGDKRQWVYVWTSSLAKEYWGYISSRTIYNAKKIKKQVYDKKENPNEYGEVFINGLKSDDVSTEDFLNNKLYEIGHFNVFTDGDIDRTFIRWLNKNKDRILTKAQQDILLDDGIGKNSQDRYDKRKAGISNILKALEKEYSTQNLKKFELLQQIQILDELLQSKNFPITLKFNLEAPVVNDIIYSELTTLQEKKEIVKCYNTESFKLNKLNLKLIVKLKEAFIEKRNELIIKVNKL